jgi:hypothetical protein
LAALVEANEVEEDKLDIFNYKDMTGKYFPGSLCISGESND